MPSYLENLIAFNVIVIAIIVVAFAFVVFKNKINIKQYFKSKEGKGASASALTAIIALSILSFLIYILSAPAHSSPFKAGTYFNDGGIYAGLDYPTESSPQCRSGSSDDRMTSNLGAWINVWQSQNKSLRLNGKYTHHSCFIGSDQNTYDGFGVELEWKIFYRNQ